MSIRKIRTRDGMPEPKPIAWTRESVKESIDFCCRESDCGTECGGYDPNYVCELEHTCPVNMTYYELNKLTEPLKQKWQADAIEDLCDPLYLDLLAVKEADDG
jgi:hypothetical protein